MTPHNLLLNYTPESAAITALRRISFPARLKVLPSRGGWGWGNAHTVGGSIGSIGGGNSDGAGGALDITASVA